MNGSAKPLSSLGGDVKKQFVLALESSQNCSANIYVDLREAAERFELWAINVGLYQKGHSSLDYRFRDAVSVRDFTRSILESLSSEIEEVNMVYESRSNPGTHSISEAVNDEFSVDSDVEELDESSWNQLMVASIRTSIAHLYRLAIKIQDPRLRMISAKVANYKEVDPVSGIDLMDVFAEYDREHIKGVTSATCVGDSFTCSGELVERLAQANTLRRKQFKCWERHHDKMQTNLHANQFDSHPVWDPKALQTATVHSMPTTATRLAPEQVSIEDDTSTLASSRFVPVEQEETEISLQIPDLPKDLQDKEEFECPFCFILCSRKQGRGERWRSHILHDLRPYICTNIHCIYGDQLFDQIDQWKLHETSHLPASTDEQTLTCPICGELSVSLTHIAVHLVRIALFALPSSCADISGSTYTSDSRSSRAWPAESEILRQLKTMSEDSSSMWKVEDPPLTEMVSVQVDDDDSPLSIPIRRGENNVVGLQQFRYLEEPEDSTLQPENSDQTLSSLVKGQSIENLAAMYSDQEWWGEAEQLEVKIRETRKVRGEDHPDTLATMADLASIYSDQGCLGEAEKLQVKVMEARKKLLSEGHVNTLTSMTNLAITYFKQGRLGEAEELQVKVMEGMEKLFGEGHSSTLLSMANLASTYLNQGRLGEAEELQVKVIEARKKLLGEDHPDTLQSVRNLAEMTKHLL